MVMKVMRKPAARSFARLSQFAHGVVYGFFLAGLSHQEIADTEELVKQDGSRAPKGAVGLSVRTSETGAHSWADDATSCAGRACRHCAM